MKYFLTMIAVLFLVPTTVWACMDIMMYTRVETAYGGPEAVTVMVVPDGSGNPLTEAWLPWGSRVDATITIFLRGCEDEAIANFPAEDMWLESLDYGLVNCWGGTIADENTDDQGTATWAQPLFAGGSSQTGCKVLVNGMAVETPPTLAIHFNSPDINGDGTVGLADVVPFATDFYGGYQFRSDFHRDGVLTLADLVHLARAMGRSCP